VIAWSDKFRLEQSAAAEVPQSWVYDLIRQSRANAALERFAASIGDAVTAILSSVKLPIARRSFDARRARIAERIYNVLLGAIVAALVALAVRFILSTVGFAEVGHVVGLGALTLLRVVVLLIFASLVWTPIGVAIGFSPRLARISQPIALFLASFPANFIFPFATLAFIRLHVSIDLGSVLLMALGAQWYILFNSIAGASSIPTDLREMADDVGLVGFNRWRRLIIPGIFSSWVTGGITASGGAWNASIVSEVVTWGTSTLTASGLGAYIASATAKGDWPRITLGVGMMSIYVVGVNRLLWRQLYALAEKKYHL
jgi:NitT/TauT family transport system permease protein